MTTTIKLPSFEIAGCEYEYSLLQIGNFLTLDTFKFSSIPLNIVTLKIPWKVKHDILERAIAILNMIETDKKKLNDPTWIMIYHRFSNSIQRELEKIDPFTDISM